MNRASHRAFSLQSRPNTKPVRARLREEGLTVYGFGEEKTPKPFVSACDKFIYTEILRAPAADSLPTEPAPHEDKPTGAQPAAPAASPQKVPVEFIAKVLDDISDEEDWVHLGALGSNISQLRPAFDPRLYGFKKLSELIKAQPKHFELQERGQTASGGKALYVRNRKRS